MHNNRLNPERIHPSCNETLPLDAVWTAEAIGGIPPLVFANPNQFLR